MGRWGFVLSSVFGMVVGTVLFTPPAQAADVTALVQMLAASSFSIINRNENNDYAARLGLDPNATVYVQTAARRCTGTFLNETDVVTAGHCVDPDDPTGGASIEGIRSVSVVVHDEIADFFRQLAVATLEGKAEEFLEEQAKEPEPQREGENRLDFLKRAFSKNFSHDFAILKMPNGTGSLLGIRSYPGFAAEAPQPGTKGILVGYGLANMLPSLKRAVVMEGELSDGGAGVKGWGETEIESTVSHFHWSKQEYVRKDSPSKTSSTDSVGSHGDSGALLYDTHGEAIGLLVAMTDDVDAIKKPIRIPNPFIPLLPLTFTGTQTKGWKPANGYASVHSPEFSDALKEASAIIVPESLKAAFPKNYLRMGLYASRDKNTPAYWAVGEYQGNLLLAVSLRAIKDGKAQAEEQFLCGLASPVCFSGEGRIVHTQGTNFNLAGPDGSVHEYMRQ